MQYKIYEEAPAGTFLALLLLFPEGDELIVELDISEDGMSVESEGALGLSYLDDKTEFEYAPEK